MATLQFKPAATTTGGHVPSASGGDAIAVVPSASTQPLLLHIAETLAQYDAAGRDYMQEHGYWHDVLKLALLAVAVALVVTMVIVRKL